jgi:hypothetical protein
VNGNGGAKPFYLAPNGDYYDAAVAKYCKLGIFILGGACPGEINCMDSTCTVQINQMPPPGPCNWDCNNLPRCE